MRYYSDESIEGHKRKQGAASVGKSIASGTEHINWKKAEKGWTRYFDDGVVTLDPKVFFRRRKKHD